MRSHYFPCFPIRITLWDHTILLIEIKKLVFDFSWFSLFSWFTLWDQTVGFSIFPCFLLFLMLQLVSLFLCFSHCEFYFSRIFGDSSNNKQNLSLHILNMGRGHLLHSYSFLAVFYFFLKKNRKLTYLGCLVIWIKNLTNWRISLLSPFSFLYKYYVFEFERYKFRI